MLQQLLATKHPHASHAEAEGLSLHRTLGPWSLTALGIGAVIGGGIFVITGQAAADHAGPAIMLSFRNAAPSRDRRHTPPDTRGPEGASGPGRVSGLGQPR